MKTSPYAGVPEGPEWLDITRDLVGKHPLSLEQLKAACLSAWRLVWRTTIGEPPLAIRLAELVVPAPVVGYFFEVLLAEHLAGHFPGAWRRNTSKDEVDVVCLTDPGRSFEIKTSGQLAFKVFGNRSYGQKPEDGDEPKKEKSGYYLTVNFVAQVVTLIRFGWIDADDWRPQASERGQAATLADGVYQYKLLPVPGAYRRAAPIGVLRQVGDATETRLAALGIRTVGDLVDREAKSPADLAEFSRVLSDNRDFLDGCNDLPPAQPNSR